MFDDPSVTEIIKSSPRWKKSDIARYDTVVVMDSSDTEAVSIQGIKLVCSIVILIPLLKLPSGCRVGQVRIIFCLPRFLGPSALQQPSPPWWNVEEPLVYIHWFSRFRSRLNPDNQMYVIEWAKDAPGQIQGAVIPLRNVRQGCMVSPTTKGWSHEWKSHTILNETDKFYVNSFQSKYTYGTIY